LTARKAMPSTSPECEGATGPILGFKDFDYTTTAIAGVELTHHIRKGQSVLGCLPLRGLTTPAV
jgi:hypothetical protein